MKPIAIIVIILIAGWWLVLGRGNSVDSLAEILQRKEIINADASIYGKDRKAYVFIYFSASWCPPCHAFTPVLVDFYNKHNQPKGSRNFDIIFVSNDESPDAMDQYMNDMDMPWAHAIYHSIAANMLSKRYGARGIPNLLLLDRTGTVLASSFDGDRYLGPEQVLTAYDSRP